MAGKDTRDQCQKVFQDERFSKRKFIHSAGLFLAAIVTSGAGVSAKESESDYVDISDEDDIDEFIKFIRFELDNTGEKKRIWSELSDRQQSAVLEKYLNSIEIVVEKGTDETLDTESEDLENDPITTHFPRNVSAVISGIYAYTFSHNITWMFDYNNVIFGTPESSISGETYVDDISYAGAGGTSFEYGPSDNWFDYYREGIFEDQVFPVTYTAILELRGKSDGTGEILQADDGHQLT